MMIFLRASVCVCVCELFSLRAVVVAAVSVRNNLYAD